MLRQSRVRRLPVFVVLLAAFLPSYANAGRIKIAHLKDTEQAPILVVGRITAIHKGERVPENVLPWRTEPWTMTADVAILRSYSLSESGKPAPGSRINVSFLAYGRKRARDQRLSPTAPKISTWSGFDLPASTKVKFDVGKLATGR